jgi:hypothetical protein
LDYASPLAADPAPITIQTVPRSTTLTGLSVPNGGYIYFRWSGADAGGSGSRDEFGLDNLSFTPSCVVPCPAISASISGNGMFCVSGNLSTIPVSVAITGGTSPYTVVYTDGTTNYTVTNYVSGTAINQAVSSSATYTLVSVTDASSCTASTLSGSAILVVSPGGLTPGAALTQPTCAAPNSGAIDLTVTGGLSPYSYAWSNAATTEDISGLSGAVYTVTVTVAGGCTASASYTLVEPTGCGCSVTAVTFGTPSACNNNGTSENPAKCEDGYKYAIDVWGEYYKEIKSKWGI